MSLDAQHANRTGQPDPVAAGRRSRWPILALLLIWVLFFWRFAPWAGSAQVMYMPGDFSETFWTYSDLVYRAWAAGERLPVWAECLWSGYPLASEPQTALFYPPKWAAFIILRMLGYGHFPLEAMHALVAAHALAASFGMFGFLRALGLRAGAAAIGASAFAYSGFMLSYAPVNSAILMGATWLPFALWPLATLAAATTLRARLARLTLTALGLALCLYAGHPQTFLYGSALVLGYGLFRLRLSGATWIGSLTLTVGSTLLTGALAAAQLALTIAFYGASQRVALDYTAAGGGFGYIEVVQLLLTGVVSYWHPLYVGILPLTLVAWALGRRDRAIWFWGLAGLAGVLLSFGARAGLYDIALTFVPGWGLFRGQERLAVVVSLSLCVLAAYGADRLLSPAPPQARRQLQVGLAWTVGLAGLAVMLALAGLYLHRLGLDRSDWGQLPDRTGVLLLASGLTLLVWWWRARVPYRHPWLPVAMVMVVALDAYGTGRPLNIVPVYEPYQPDVLVEPMASTEGFFRVQDDGRLVGHAGCHYGYADVNGRTPVVLAGYARLLESAPEPVRWKLLGVRYVVTGRDTLPAPAEVVAERDQPPAPPAPADRFSVLPEPGSRSRTFRLAGEVRQAWLAPEVRALPDASAVSAALSAPGLDPYQTALVVATPGGSFGTGAPDGPGPIGAVEVTAEAHGFLHLRVQAERSGLLVISLPAAPGWQATLDGAAVATRPAFNSLLALMVPAGEHTVALEYTPPGWVAGSRLTVVAMLLSAALLLARWLEVRRSARARSRS